MKVILAGYNLDAEILKDMRERFETIARTLDSFHLKILSEPELRQAVEKAERIASEVLTKDNLTPETLSAAYARISRLPLPIPEIRKAAREGVAHARRSNQQIVFEMGHRSIAEHAVFNFDILDISRLATEFVETNRLGSFTEKSQRYIRFEEDVLIPQDIVESTLLASYKEVVHRLFATYKMLYEAIYQNLCRLYPDQANDEKESRQLQQMAGEDARYVLPLATFTQIGMTLNARALEWMIWKAKAHPLTEVKKFGQELLTVTDRITPSLVRYTEPNKEYCDTGTRLRKYLTDNPLTDRGEDRVRMLTSPKDGDDHLLAALLFSKGTSIWEHCRQLVESYDPEQKKSVFRSAMEGLGANDPVWREFETLDFEFEVILSASAFAQLKRHRMSTQLAQPYDPDLSVVVPPSVSQAGLEEPFLNAVQESTKLFRQICKKSPSSAEYTLTNAHQRRLLLHVNARELYHMARLRMDHTAQWEIRDIITEIIGIAEKACPLTLALAVGKDRFEQRYGKLYDSDQSL